VTGKQGYQGTRGQVEIAHWLEQAHALRPGDLYVNYHLWQQAREAGDAEAAAAYGEALTHFYLEAIYPVDERLLHHAAEVIPALIEEGLWDRGQALNVVSFLVWQHDRAAGVERLIERLAERYPAEPEWPFYLAELYHRRGDLERARVVYQQVLAAHPEYAQAVLRLGMVAEARFQTLDPKPQDQLETAASWYGQYHDIAPDDLLGLKRLVDTCTALGEAGAEGGSCPEVTLQEALEARVDGRRVAAQMLGVPVEQVKLGPNLVDNGWFAEGKEGQLERWYFRAYLGPTREGLYFAGLDSLAGEGNSARIIGLRGGPMADGTVTYGECTGEELTLFPGSRYLISARYRSMNLDGNGLLFLGEYFKPDGVRLTHTYLEGSSGEWREVFILVQGQDRKISVVPLIRNWGLGSVWFDDVQVRAIGLPEMTDPGADEKGQQ
jgi:tetratricopeptide (TPR) repeat protein